MTRGRGKRTQKNDSSALKSVEDSSEVSLHIVTPAISI